MDNFETVEDLRKQVREEMGMDDEGNFNIDEPEQPLVPDTDEPEIPDTDEPETPDEEEQEEEIVTEDDEPEEPVKPVKPTKKEKEENAFKQLRDKANAESARASEYEAQLKEFEDLALSLGFKNGKELLTYQREQQLQKEAKEKGVDPIIYKELQDLKKQQETYQSEIKQSKQRESIDRVRRTLDSFALEQKLSDVEKEILIQNLDNDGYTIEDLINIKKPEKLFSGYVADIIADRKVQKATKERKELSEKQFTNPLNEATDDDINKLVEERLAKYKKENGFQ